MRQRACITISIRFIFSALCSCGESGADEQAVTRADSRVINDSSAVHLVDTIYGHHHIQIYFRPVSTRSDVSIFPIWFDIDGKADTLNLAYSFWAEDSIPRMYIRHGNNVEESSDLYIASPNLLLYNLPYNLTGELLLFIRFDKDSVEILDKLYSESGFLLSVKDSVAGIPKVRFETNGNIDLWSYNSRGVYFYKTIYKADTSGQADHRVLMQKMLRALN